MKPTSSNCVQNAFFRFFVSPRWAKVEKTPLGSNSTTSVSYHHFDWAFPSTQNGCMKPNSWNSILRVFFRFAPMGKVEKTRFERNWTTFVKPGFLPCLEKPIQNVCMKPNSWNSILRVFFGFAPMGKVEKKRFERNWTTFVNRLFALLGKAHSK